MADEVRSYTSPQAFRAALEHRLRQRHVESALPLDRLRKEAAAQRFLARLVAVAPEGSWALKGGLALIALIGPRARATRDADATWRLEVDELTEVMDKVIECDLNDGFAFEIGIPVDITAEGPERGLRYPVTARLAGCEFERLQLDANIMPGDPRRIVMMELRNAFEFAGLDPVTVPMVPTEQQLAEKLHAYTRDYGGRENARARDLYDLLAIVEHVELPAAGVIAASCLQTFELRRTPWPPMLPPPPESWGSTWASLSSVHGSPWPDLDAAYDALKGFWEHLMTLPISTSSTWSAVNWTWST